MLSTLPLNWIIIAIISSSYSGWWYRIHAWHFNTTSWRLFYLWWCAWSIQYLIAHWRNIFILFFAFGQFWRLWKFQIFGQVIQNKGEGENWFKMRIWWGWKENKGELWLESNFGKSKLGVKFGVTKGEDETWMRKEWNFRRFSKYLKVLKFSSSIS